MLICSDIVLRKTLPYNRDTILATGFPSKATKSNIIFRFIPSSELVEKEHMLRIKIDSAGKLTTHYNRTLEGNPKPGEELYGTCFLLYA